MERKILYTAIIEQKRDGKRKYLNSYNWDYKPSFLNQFNSQPTFYMSELFYLFIYYESRSKVLQQSANVKRVHNMKVIMCRKKD